MKNRAVALLKVAVTFLLFSYIFNVIDFKMFGETLRNARLNILIFGFLVLCIGHYICIFRWRMLMRPLMPALSLGNLLGIYWIGLFFNLTFPTVVGGDVVKMYYAGKPSKSYAQSFAATFLDRDAGMLAMLIIACTSTLVDPIDVPKIPVSFIIWSAFIVFVAGNVAIFTPRFHFRLTCLLRRLKLSKIAKKIEMISGAFQVMGKHRSVLLGSLLISLINQLLFITMIWILALGLRIEARYSYFLVFVPVITLISMIPISINGMGLREYAFMSLFGSVGIPLAACTALGLLSSIVLILSSLPGGVIYIFFRNRSEFPQLAAIENDLT
jgi:uncharacterized protein (TIRG00374 family)